MVKQSVHVEKSPTEPLGVIYFAGKRKPAESQREIAISLCLLIFGSSHQRRESRATGSPDSQYGHTQTPKLFICNSFELHK
jgi:hypothetical protein